MGMPLVVLKFGGSSLASPRLIQRAAARIQTTRAAGNDLVVVVSAMGRMTDHLIVLANKTVKHPPQRELDMLMTAGERVSMALMAMALHELGVPAISFTGSQSGILTTSHHNDARILEIKANRIREELDKKKVVIVAGFQGVSREKEVTTLGRGGSDTSAVALAASLGADRCDILTDVDGLFTADPRLVPAAHLISYCTYDEALELASLGAKMHARSVEVAKRFNVKVRIASSANEASNGTELVLKREENMESTQIRGIATKDGYTYFRCAVPLQEILEGLEAERIPLRFFNFAEGRTTFLADKERLPALKRLLQSKQIAFEEVPKVAILSVVGEGITGSSDILPRTLRALKADGAECLFITSNSHSITVAINSVKLESAAQGLHREFLETVA